MGSPDTLRGVSKIYAATHKIPRVTGEWRGAELNDRIYAEVPTPLLETMSGDGPTVTLTVSDDFSSDPPESVCLRVRMEEWVVGDDVEVAWDGDPLPDPHIEYTDVRSYTGDRVSGVVWQSYTLDPERVPMGEHTVKVVLRHRNPHIIPDMTLDRRGVGGEV